jgi:HlyD family secretion protein
MSNPLFPPEILDYSAESYYAKLNIHSKIIYLSILLFVISIILALPFIKIDVTTQSRGVIRSPFENTIIQSSVYGEIVSFSMYENKPVSAGDTLLAINTERIDEQINLEWQKKNDNDTFINDIQLLLSGKKEVISPKYKIEYNRYRSKIRENKIQTDYLKKEYETAEILYNKKVISKSEYLKEKNNWESANSLSSYIINEYRTSWQNEQTRLEMENHTILSNIAQLEKEKINYALTAPVSGTLIQVAGFQTGNFIAPSQAVAYISSSDSLLAECYLSPFDIGYIKKNQSAVFQIDAYDYRYFGMLEGNVIEILNDVVAVSDNPMFRVRCKLKSDCLQLKNGYEGHVKKGMTLTCRFHLTRRSLWQLLFDKVDNWMNPKVVRENEH